MVAAATGAGGAGAASAGGADGLAAAVARRFDSVLPRFGGSGRTSF